MVKRNRKSQEKEVILPTKFIPQFFNSVDGRCGVVKEIRRRYERLKRDTGITSYQQEMLCQRAIFIGIQLETMECNAAEGKSFESNVYTQMVNTLTGLLKALGLNKVKTVDALAEHLKQHEQSA